MKQTKQKRQTQDQIVLNYLLTGKKLTSWKAITKWNITRLSAIIHRLIHVKNHKIKSKLIVERNTRWTEYWMDKKKK